jgi:hypothetical protein
MAEGNRKGREGCGLQVLQRTCGSETGLVSMLEHCAPGGNNQMDMSLIHAYLATTLTFVAESGGRKPDLTELLHRLERLEDRIGRFVHLESSMHCRK